MKGFTFIELLIVIFIVALLSTIGAVTVSRVLMQARDVKRASIMHDLQNALELYNIRNENYVNSPDICGLVSVLVTGNYLPVAPVDPKTKMSICDNGLYNYYATPSGGNATSYLLKLTKESGGYADFYSP